MAEREAAWPKRGNGADSARLPTFATSDWQEMVERIHSAAFLADDRLAPHVASRAISPLLALDAPDQISIAVGQTKGRRPSPKVVAEPRHRRVACLPAYRASREGFVPRAHVVDTDEAHMAETVEVVVGEINLVRIKIDFDVASLQPQPIILVRRFQADRFKAEIAIEFPRPDQVGTRQRGNGSIGRIFLHGSLARRAPFR